MERNIIIRLAIENGDTTFIATRMEYVQLYRRNARIIFALEYPDEETAEREIAHF